MSLVLVFDMDDTLFPESDFVYSGFKEVDQFLKNKLSINNFFDRACEKFTLGDRGYIFNQFLDEINYDGDIIELVKELVGVYRSHKPRIKLHSDAEWALKYYSELAPLVLLSDGYLETQKNKFESLNIDKYFQKYYFTDQWGSQYWKPSTFGFEKIELDYKLYNSEFVYISDNPLKDFIAPNELGWDSIYIDRKSGEYKNSVIPFDGIPKKTINSLFQLKDILDL